MGVHFGRPPLSQTVMVMVTSFHLCSPQTDQLTWIVMWNISHNLHFSTVMETCVKLTAVIIFNKIHVHDTAYTDVTTTIQ
jgi:hypothetical protein